MENEERKVFIDKLPVSEPVPVAKPNKNIQLAPIVQPMAVVPFVSFDGDDVDVKVQKSSVASEPEVAPTYESNGFYQEPQPQYYEEPQYDQYNHPAYYAPKGYGNQVKQYGQYGKKGKKKKSGKGPNRLAALLSFIFTLIAVAPFVLNYEKLGLSAKLPEFLRDMPDVIGGTLEIIKALQDKVIGIKDLFSFEMIGGVLLILGVVFLALNLIVSLIALIAGSRPNYVIMAVLVMMLLIAGACLVSIVAGGFDGSEFINWAKDYFGTKKFLKEYDFLITVVDGIAFLILEIIAFAVGSKNQYIED